MNLHAFKSKPWQVIAAMLLVAGVLRAPADPLLKTPEPGRNYNYTGVVICVETNKQQFQMKRSPWSARQFAYGDKCEIAFLYATLANGVGTPGDLRPGEKVTVSYQDVHGVCIAGRIEQQPRQVSGVVKELNSEKHQLTLRRWIFDRRMKIAPGCITLLGDDKTGTLADIHPGDHVVVAYETPGGNQTAYQITRTNAAASPAR